MIVLLYGVVLLCSYLLGSIPTGYIMGGVKGIDLRQSGSGRTGAANTLRTLGFTSSVIVLIVDIAKGFFSVLLARYVLHSPTGELIAGMGAVMGHNWSLYMGFGGGRGVATSLGVLLAMYPAVAVMGMGVFVAVITLTRYISLGSIVAASIVPLAFVPLVLSKEVPLDYLLFGSVGALLIIVQHRDNIARLRAGTERRIGERARGMVSQ